MRVAYAVYYPCRPGLTKEVMILLVLCFILLAMCNYDKLSMEHPSLSHRTLINSVGSVSLGT